MSHKKVAPDEAIPATDFKMVTTFAMSQLHITGGLRAIMQVPGMWSLQPLLSERNLVALKPMPIDAIFGVAVSVGAMVFGADEISGLDSPLRSRTWTPLDRVIGVAMQPADTWNLIAGTAARSGDEAYSALARNFAYSLHAAGIRLRDASDCYHVQLRGALAGKRAANSKFSNIPLRDLQLAFHSVLSELASARDYLAALLAQKLGAPSKVDALSRLLPWIDKQASKGTIRGAPVMKAMLDAYDSAKPDPWLHQLTQYRNLFLHREPLGASVGSHWLRYLETEVGAFVYPAITMPLGDADPSAPGIDALLRFVGLYRQMMSLARLAAQHAPYEPKFQTVTIT